MFSSERKIKAGSSAWHFLSPSPNTGFSLICSLDHILLFYQSGGPVTAVIKALIMVLSANCKNWKNKCAHTRNLVSRAVTGHVMGVVLIFPQLVKLHRTGDIFCQVAKHLDKWWYIIKQWILGKLASCRWNPALICPPKNKCRTAPAYKAGLSLCGVLICGLK